MSIEAISSGKTALITGGASGIGLAAANRFARKGMNIVIVDRRSDPLAAAEETLRKAGAGDVLARNLDVSDRSALRNPPDVTSSSGSVVWMC